MLLFVLPGERIPLEFKSYFSGVCLFSTFLLIFFSANTRSIKDVTNVYKLWLPKNLSLATAQEIISPAVVTFLNFTGLGFHCLFDGDIPRLRDH